MGITVIDKYGSTDLDHVVVKNFVEFLFRRFGVSQRKELNVVLCGDNEMSVLNLRYTGRRGTTDVLSFFGYDGSIIGDIVVSLDVAVHECENEDMDYLDYVLFLVAHGFLHLLGYKHDSEDELGAMIAIQHKLLEEWKYEAERSG